MDDDPAHPLDGKFEPEAKDIITSQSDAALVSIAVSLKRIADAVAPADGQDIGTTLFYMEQRLGPRS